MVHLHGNGQAKPKFMLDSDDLARVVGTAVGAALAQLEHPVVGQRPQQLPDAGAARQPASNCCDRWVGQCSDTYDMRQPPSEHVYSTRPFYEDEGQVRFAPPAEDREDASAPVRGLRRGGLRYPAQDEVEEPTPAPVPEPELDDASEASRRAAGGV